MKCPVCSDATLVMSERQGIEIDYCPSCRGVWLDRGELDKIIERSAAADEAAAAAAPPAPPQPAPQAPYPPQAGYPPQQHYAPQHGYGHRPHKRRKHWLQDIFD
jgi:hypothetical protein